MPKNLKSQQKNRVKIGIDEAGRGPLAGPVAVGAFLFRAGLTSEIKKMPIPLRDSKKLTEIQREIWFAKILEWQKEGKADFSVSFAAASAIDKIGISQCIKNSLAKSLEKIYMKDCIILLDGGLKAPEKYKNQKTIIKGDEKEPAISLASICVKVLRDRLMKKYAKKFPNYGLEKHKGYGTAKHYENIRLFGVCSLHRKSYLKALDF